MKKRLVIDSQLAAQDPVGAFGDDWSWPVAQSQYDAPITEFFKWSDELHKEINDSPRLLNAFLLIKPDLLKDFSYYADAWLEIAGAKRAGFDVVFNSGQYILQSIVTGEYGGGQFPTENLRKPPRAGLRGKLRTRL